MSANLRMASGRMRMRYQSTFVAEVNLHPKLLAFALSVAQEESGLE